MAHLMQCSLSGHSTDHISWDHDAMIINTSETCGKSTVQF